MGEVGYCFDWPTGEEWIRGPNGPWTFAGYVDFCNDAFLGAIFGPKIWTTDIALYKTRNRES